MTTPLHHPAELMRLIEEQIREEVHHKDGNPLNNDLSNLTIIVRVKRVFSEAELERGRTTPVFSSHVAPSLTSELRGKRNGSET